MKKSEVKGTIITIANDTYYTFEDVPQYSFFIDGDEDLCLKLSNEIEKNNAICISGSFLHTYFLHSKVTPVTEIKVFCK